MKLFHINHKNIHNGILFNALYSAIVFATIFIVNDYIDESIIPHLEKKSYHSFTKFIIHICIIFVISIIVVYVMWWIFGWGKQLTEA